MLEGTRLDGLLAPLSFDAAALAGKPELQRRAALQLRRHGLLILRSAADRGQLQNLGRVVDSAWHLARHGKAGDPAASVLINRGKRRAIRGYRALVGASKAVISIRANEDAGMLDVFHPEKLIPEASAQVVNALAEGLVIRLLDQAFGRPFQVQARNLYVNRGVLNTRGFHTDGGGMKAKAFLYLSDVGSLAQGPFCYVPGSHRWFWRRWLNRWHSRAHGRRPDDCALLPGQIAVPVLCATGDLVIAMQHGVHRGLPQQPGAERAVLLSMLQPIHRQGLERWSAQPE